MRTPRTPSARTRKAPVWPARFLGALGDTHMVTEACKVAGVARSTVYKHRQEDAKFAAAWSEIEERSTEQLEREAYHRAADGWVERQIFDDEGEPIGEVRKFSDPLLMFLLKARRPDTYRENHRIEHSGVDGAPIAAEITTVDAREHADATREYLARLAGPDA